MLDESAGGFGVRVEHTPEVVVGDVVRLSCSGKCFEVEVKHIMLYPPLDGAELDGAEDEKRDKPACKLGVQRLREVFQETDARSSWFKGIRAKWYRPPFSLDGKGIGLGIAIAFLVGVLPAVAVLSWGPSVFDRQVSLPAKNGSVVGMGVRPSNFKPSKIKADGSFAVTGEGISTAREGVSRVKSALNARQKGVWQSLLDRAKQQVDIEPWTDAVLALLEKLVRQMGLSDLEQVESTQLLEYTDQSLANLDAADTGDNKAEVAQKRLSILEEAYASLMKMFNETQQKKWEELVEKKGQASDAK